jgi:hypothetical protein
MDGLVIKAWISPARPLLLLFLIGCSGSDSGPTTVSVVADREAKIIQVADGSVSYSMNLSTMELSSSDGRVIQFTSHARASEVATLFEAANAGDELATWFDENPPPDPYENCGSGGPCPELRAEGPVTGNRMAGSWRDQVPTVPSRTLSMRRASSDRPSRTTRKVEKGKSTRFDFLPAMQFASLEEPFSCFDIVSSMFAVRSAAEDTKFSIFGLLGDMFDAIEFTIVGGVLRGTMGASFPQGVQFLEGRAAHMTNVTALHFLAGLYNANGCATNNWESTSGSAAGGSWHYVCWDEWWEISFDLGATWYPILREFCEYQWVD